jgi:hypothetical protein
MVWLVRTTRQYQGGRQKAMVARDACPACASPQFKKNGHIHTGKQHHRCKNCGRQFVMHADIRLIDEDRRALVVRLLLENISLHGICRAVGVSIRWLIDFGSATQVMLAIRFRATVDQKHHHNNQGGHRQPWSSERAVKKLEITVPAAVTPKHMERLGTDGRFREASSRRHGILTPAWKGQSSQIPASPGSLRGAGAGYRPETPRPLPPPGEHRLPPRTPVLTTADA